MLFGSIFALGVPAWAKLVLVLALGAHGLVRRPHAETRIMTLQSDGRWSLPEVPVTDLRLGVATIYTTHWVSLVLVGGAQTYELLLFEDQFDPASWRILQARLRGAESSTAL